MVDNPLGALTEIANASETRLAVDTGSGTYDYYVLLKDLELSIGKTETRDVVTSGGPLYSYGAGDNFLTATIFYTETEVTGVDYTNSSTPASFNELTQLGSNGQNEEIDWLLIIKDVSGSEKFWSITGVLRDFKLRKPAEGKVEVDIFIRITGNTVSVADSAP